MSERTSGRDGRLTLPSVDVHTHLAPVLEPEELRRNGLTVAASGVLHADRRRLGPPELYEVTGLLEHLDRTSTDVALVSAPPPLYRSSLEEAPAARWAEDLNAGLARATAIDRRLRALAHLPLEHPQVAVDQVGLTAGDERWAGFSACAGGRSPSMADPRLAPLWRAVADSGRPLVLHPGQSPDGRLADYYLSNLLGNPQETALAVAQLVLGGVLHDHPGLRIVLVHGGGAVPSVVGRWDRGTVTERPGVPRSRLLPSQAVRGLWIDCLAHHEGALDLARRVFGDEHVLLGSDWPFPMGCDDPRDLIRHLGEREMDRICRQNAAALLGPGTGRRGLTAGSIR